LLGTLLLEQHVLDLAKLLCEPGPQPRKNIRVSDALDLVREDDVVDGKPWPARQSSRASHAFARRRTTSATTCIPRGVRSNWVRLIAL
jgi:hypothetical protein